MSGVNSGRGRNSILLVDDNRDLLETMAEALEMDGHSVLRARNGMEALKLAAHCPVSLVLLDLSMPVMDGWEFLQVRKSTPKLAAVPVVVLSAYASLKPRGADDVVQKPIGLDELRSIIRRYCPASASSSEAPATTGTGRLSS
jgi:CheY-like chemotaxis protein